MARAFIPKVITANDLFEGDVIYLKADGTWSRDHGEAAVADTAERADDLLAVALAQQDVQIGAYAADAHIGSDGQPAPVHFREVFRTRGPSNYPHGKQAQA